MAGWSQADLNRHALKRAQSAKPSKYHAQAVIIDNVRFDSKKEGARYLELKALQAAGEIRDLGLQPAFELFAHRVVVDRRKTHSFAVCVGEYRADFRYTWTASGETVIEDVKAPITRTPLYKLKKKIVEACYGITITEV